MEQFPITENYIKKIKEEINYRITEAKKGLLINEKVDLEIKIHKEIAFALAKSLEHMHLIMKQEMKIKMIEAKKIVVEEKLELEQEMQQLALEASEK
jgi:hypothetical protein